MNCVQIKSKLRNSPKAFCVSVLFLFFFSFPCLNTFSDSSEQKSIETKDKYITDSKSTTTVSKPTATSAPQEVVKQTYTIKASADEFGGQITPAGETPVVKNSNQTYTIAPKSGYLIDDVQIDGTSIGPVDSYSFDNNASDHTIEVRFKRNNRPGSLVIYPNQNFSINQKDVIKEQVTSVINNHQNLAVVHTYNIFALANLGGNISPSGTITVSEASNQTFVITPSVDHLITDVKVDGISVGAVSAYTFNNIRAEHTISAFFSSFNPGINYYTITTSTNSNGSVIPRGVITTAQVSNQTISIVPDVHYHIADVLVDGSSVGAVSTYTFSHISADHLLSAIFAINTHVITASFGSNGLILPSGTLTVNEGGDQTFSILPAANYHIQNVLVDGVSVGAVTSYPFNNVSADHTISVTFAHDLPSYVILSSSGDHGHISPVGVNNVTQGSSQVFTIIPDSGYQIQSVLVDNIVINLVNNTYTFTNVTSNHTIEVNFVPIGTSTNNFRFVFDSSTTLLKELNWKNANGISKRIVWDEETRFEPDHHSPSWLNIYLHSFTGADPSYFHSSWCFSTVDNNPANCVPLTHADIHYQFLAPSTSDRVQIQASSTGLTVQDDFHFVDDTIYLNVTMTNTLDQEMKRVDMPVHLGGLVIGNFDTNIRKIYVCTFGPDGFCPNPNDGPGLARLRNIKSGTIEGRFENPAGSGWDMYPGGYSPVAVLWGAAKFNADNTIVNCGNPTNCDDVTIGAQFLTNVSFPTTIGFQEIPANPHSPMLNARIITSLLPGESRTYNLVYQLVDGEGLWEDSLLPYKNWFNLEYGTFNPQRQQLEPTPQYCPTAPFHYGVGSNSGGGYYDLNTMRYLPNTTLRNLFAVNTVLQQLQQSGIKRFGVWKTAINGNLIGGNEFDPNITLIDPNIDAGPDRSKINDFTSAFAQNNVDIFWFARPCRYIEGANIDYSVYPPIIRGGTWNGSVDLRESATRDRYFNDMKSFVDRGVKGFYLDEGNFCPGFENFLKYIRDEFKRQNNVDLFLLQEGSIDRNSLISPQIPVIKLPYYDWNTSILLNYLVPDATYYGGGINSSLSEAELDDILSKGYQAISGTVLTSRFCHVLKTSYDNQVIKWQRYGQRIGCPAPDPVSDACLNYPDKYYTVTITSNTGGSVSPSGVLPHILEGWDFTMTITADPGYHISRIGFYHNGLGTFEIHPTGNTTTYTLISPPIFDNANFDVTFE